MSFAPPSSCPDTPGFVWVGGRKSGQNKNTDAYVWNNSGNHIHQGLWLQASLIIPTHRIMYAFIALQRVFMIVIMQQPLVLYVRRISAIFFAENCKSFSVTVCDKCSDFINRA